MARVSTDAAERFLAAPLLAEMGDPDRRAVLDAVTERREPDGAPLLGAGRPNDRLWFLVEGAVTVEHAGPDGRPEAVATLAAPSLFGTTSFFSPRPPSFGVRAAGAVVLLTLTRGDYDRLRRDHPTAAEALSRATLRVLSERFDDLNRMFTEYADHHPDADRVTEWAGFRARLFEEPGV